MTAPRTRLPVGRVGRADLLLALQELSWTGPVLLTSHEASFVRQQVVQLAATVESGVTVEADPETPAPELPREPQVTQDRLRFESQWIVTEDRSLAQLAPLEREAPLLTPLDSAQIKAERDRVGSSVVRGHWPWFRRRLRQALNPLNHHHRQPIDFERLGQQLATGTVPEVWPRRRLERWPGGLTLLIDERPLLGVLQGEFDLLASKLRRSIGSRSVRVLRRNFGSAVLPRTPGPGPLLVVTDWTGLPPHTLHWFKEQRRNQRAPLVLCPEPGAGVGVEQIALVSRGQQDRGSLAPLRALIDAFGYVDDRLLKALVEEQCPGRSSWRHLLSLLRDPMIERFPGDLGFGITECRSELGSACTEVARLPAARIARAMQRMQLLHGLEGATSYYGGMLRFASRLQSVSPALSRQLDLADHYFLQQVGPRLAHTPDPALALRVVRALRSQGPLREKARYAQLLGQAVAVSEQEWDAAPPQSVPRRAYVLRAVGSQLRVSPEVGGPLRAAVLAQGLQLPEQGASMTAVLGHERRVVYLKDCGSGGIDGGEHTRLGVVAGDRLVELVRVQRPSWALGWGRDRQGAYVLVPSPFGKPQRFRIPEGEGEHPVAPWIPAGASEVLQPLPPTAGAKLAIGIDHFGVFVTVEINGSTQRLRWIEPGSFLMGSPGDDDWAFRDEKPQHQVTLSRGYWLADTACTQAFWLAVVEDKYPRESSDDLQCPVEQVSFTEVQQRFFSKLRALLTPRSTLRGPLLDWREDSDGAEGLRPELPSEAEWEYACRAGTSTRYNVGDALSPAQANFGNRLRRTLPVADLPPNRWGLYAMHGNVREWCRDGLRAYTRVALVDPEGPQGLNRAVRGGSWFYGARGARSACRLAYLGSYRFDDLGFRWCLRPSS